MEDQLSLPSVHVTVPSAALDVFTTLLQSGIEVKTTNGETLGKFISKFPGFTAEYLAETVQTIFLNGTAVDDLTRPFEGGTPVLALSAAMPGLAGAIFRRNSFHSALRTATAASSSQTSAKDDITVIVKLFNSIAREKGVEILRRGVCVRSPALISFLEKRQNLLSCMLSIRAEDKELNHSEFVSLLHQHGKINLYIAPKND